MNIRKNEMDELFENLKKNGMRDGSSYETNDLYRSLGFRLVGGPRDVIVKENCETKNGVEYKYLIISLSKEFLEFMGCKDKVNLWIDETNGGYLGFSNGDSITLKKIGNRFQFKSIKNKLVDDAAVCVNIAYSTRSRDTFTSVKDRCYELKIKNAIKN